MNNTYEQFIQSSKDESSKFVAEVFENFFGSKLDHKNLWNEGEEINSSDLVDGDLVFFNSNGTSHSYVGIYQGDNTFVHSGSNGVEESKINDEYWESKFDGVRRISRNYN